MTGYKGDQVVLGFKQETTFNEQPVEGDQTHFLGIVPNLDIDAKWDWKDYWTVNGDRDRFTESQGKATVGITIPFELQSGMLFHLALENISESGTNPTTHIMNGGIQPLRSIVIEQQYMGAKPFLRYLTGCKVNTMSIQAVEGGEVKGSMALLAARAIDWTNAASTVVPTTTRPYMYHHSELKVDDHTYPVVAWTVSINHNLKVRHTCRITLGQYAYAIIEGKHEYEVKATVLLEDVETYNKELWRLLRLGSICSVVLEGVRDGEASYTASSDAFQITGTNCVLKSAPHDVPESGEDVTVEISLSPRSLTVNFKDDIPTYIST